MRFKVNIVLLIFIVTISIHNLSAQNTLGYTDPDIHYRNGVELYEKSNFSAARQEFNTFLEKRNSLFNTNDYNAIAAEYYLAVCGLYSDDPDAELLVDRFVRNHPEHPKASVIYNDLGTFYFNKQDYDNAITYLEKALKQSQNYNLQNDTKFKLALSYYSTQQYKPALALFNVLKKDIDTKYFATSAYYAGVILYQNKDYEAAYKSFKLIESSPEYRADIPNWIVSSLYQAGNYDQVLAYSEPILRNQKAGGIKLNDVALYTAEVYYNRADYAAAATNYALFNKYKIGKMPSSTQFRFGHSLFKTSNYTAAADQLKAVANTKDSLGQNASYLLGISQLQNKKPQAALIAFDQAAKLNFNKSVKEEASFNHAKLNLDQSNTNAAISEFQEYLKNFQNSENEKEAQKLLIRAFSSANNNVAAIGYIEGLKKIDDEFKTAYQRLTYNQGISEFNAERYAQAIINFDKSLKFTPNNEIETASIFQKAESFSALSRYGEAMPLYSQVIRQNPNATLAIKSFYSLGYAYYNTKDYSNALTNFQNYLNKGAATMERQTIEDATIRMADCYLTEKNYSQATALYEKAEKEGRLDRDYALYQRGLILTYQEKDNEAKTQFDKVILQFPTSRYADDALFQSANIDLSKGNYPVAIRSYTKLIKEKPKSYLVPAALLKRALAYNNIQVYEEAIKDYKKILSDFPDAPSKNDALLGLRNTLEASGRLDEMSDVLADFKKKNPESTETEKLEFETAKGLYANEKFPQAIKSLQNFINYYPKSEFAQEANYYIGESYYRLNDLAAALKSYYQVISDGTSKFVTKSALRAGDIEAKEQNYSKAIRNYILLANLSESKVDQATGQIRLMDTYFTTKKYDSTAFFAQQIINNGDLIPNSSKKAQMMLGRVYTEKSDYTSANNEFKKILSSSKDEFGAEAKYWLSDLLFRQKKYKEAQASIMELNKQFADYEKWRVNAFILLADVYLGLNDPEQAKATLQSVIDNSEDKEAIEIAKVKLAQIQ